MKNYNQSYKSIFLSRVHFSENMNEYARKELLSMIQQLLLEADLSGELEAFLSSSDTSFAGIQVILI